MKKITAYLLIAVVLLMPNSSFAMANRTEEIKDRIIFKEDFNSEITNVVPKNIALKGKNVRVAERVKGSDKAAYMELKDGFASMKSEFENAEESVGISFDVLLGGTRCGMSVSVSDGKNSTELLNIDKDGTAQLHNSYRISGIAPKVYQNITVLYNGRKKTYSILVNGKSRISDWKITSSSALSNVSNVNVNFNSDESEEAEASYVMMDNILIYKGYEYINPDSIPKSSYNSAFIEYLPEMEFETEPEVYVSTDFDTSVNGIAFTPKGNICEIYEDKKDNNKYARMERTSSDDVYFDINAKPKETTAVVEMDIKYDKNCYQGSLSIRDSTGAGTDVLKISGGAISASTGGSTLAKLSNREWTRIAVVYNINNSTFDFYKSGELIASNVAATKKIANIAFFRIYGVGGSGSADLMVDNIRVYDGSKPNPNLDFSNMKKIAVTRYDTTVESMIKDKLVFTDYSDYVFYGGSRKKADVPVYKENGNLMIPAAIYMDGIGINIDYNKETGDISVGATTKLKVGETVGESAGRSITLEQAPCVKDGQLYLGAKDIFTTVYGKTVTDCERGLTIISSVNSEYTEDQIAKISNYMIYDHPTAEEINKIFEERKPEHPRVFADKKTFDDLKENWQKNDIKKAWGEALILSANKTCQNLDNVVKYNIVDDGNRKRLLATCREVYGKARTLGMAYWLTGDKKYADRLWLELDSAAHFPDWNPGHPLDVSEMSMAFAIGYDWCYDAWSDEQKSELEDAMFKFGIIPYHNAQYGGAMAWTIVEKNNRGIVNNAGAAVAAMAVYEKNPELCAEFISNSMWGMDYPMECFYPSGEWWEGAGYWGYALDYFSDYQSTVLSCFGTSFNMLNAIGLDKTAEFAMYSMGSKIADNFHDTGRGGTTYSPCVYWLSDHLNDPNSTKIMLAKAGKTGSAQSILWYNTDITGTNFQAENDKFFDGEDEYFSMRSSWTDDSATILLGHAGQGEGGHSHLDTGTFVLDMMGERWAEDIGSDSYGIKGLDSKSTRYLYYRYSPQGHNCLVINPKENDTFYDMYSFCPLYRKEFKEKGGYVIYDMTPAQIKHATDAKRGYRLDDNRRSAVIRDEVSLTKNDSDVYWFMQTLANIDVVDNNTVLLTNGNKKVKITFITDADEMTITAGGAKPLEGTSDFPEQADNTTSGYKRIAVKLKASGKMYIQAKFTPVGDICENSPNVNIPLEDWTAPDGKLEDLPILSDISVGGKTIQNFTPTTVSYEYILDDLNAKPEVTATADENVTVEKTVMGDDIIFVARNKDGELYRRYIVSFKPVARYPDIEGMTRLPVYEIIASSNPEEQNGQKNVSDNDFKTRWTSNGDMEYIILDLGDSRDIDAAGVAVYTWNGTRVYTYDIQVSNDCEIWTTVKEGVKNQKMDDSMEVTRFNRVNARYIRLLCHCSNVNSYNNILEFAALQTK